MAAFGISFPKLSLCRSTTSKADLKTNSPTTSTSNTRTLSLSIKNVPSQPLQYDISTTTTATPKKKATTMATILAIDGETKQLPKTLSVFNELQLDDIKDERRSNHTFTPPTSSLSNQSSHNDLHLVFSTISVDLPPLNFAIENFLTEDENCSTLPSDLPVHQAQSFDVSTEGLNETKSVRIDKIENRFYSSHSSMSNSLKWYVSELRINRPLIYRTSSIDGDREEEENEDDQRKFSQSFDDLNQINHLPIRSIDCQQRRLKEKTDHITYSTLSLPNWKHRSIPNIPLSNPLSSLNDASSRSPIQRTLQRSMARDDTLIRNESVKKKLFDILNDDELENACLEDLSQEFEKISLDPSHAYSHGHSFSSSDDDAQYFSPSTGEFHLPTISSSFDENLSAHVYKSNEHYFARSRLITTSLDKIPLNNNFHHHSSSSCLRPSWYTSPSPQWHLDEQSQRKEKTCLTYSLMNSSTPLINDTTIVFPIIQEKSSNLIMFI